MAKEPTYQELLAEEITEDSSGEPGKPQLSDWDFVVAFEGPAPHVNRLYITRHAEIIRLAFAEQHTENLEPQFRAAVSMSQWQALELMRLLRNFVGHLDPMEDDAANGT
jgi:hypothetical protein